MEDRTNPTPDLSSFDYVESDPTVLRFYNDNQNPPVPYYEPEFEPVGFDDPAFDNSS
jgi:hypothetical protein